MMSKCLTRFPIKLRKTQYLPEFRGFYKNWGILLKEVVKMDFIVEVIEGVGFRKGVPP